MPAVALAEQKHGEPAPYDPNNCLKHDLLLALRDGFVQIQQSRRNHGHGSQL